MDSAYDHIQEESYPQDPTKQGAASTANETANNFNAEIQDAYKAISSSPWAARLGGFLGSVKKQGEQYYDNASKQYAPLTQNATAGVSNLIKHARNLSVQATEAAAAAAAASKSEADETTNKDVKDVQAEKAKEDPDAHPDRPESLPADIVKEAQGIVSRFRSEATKRLKDIEKAEDAADEALLKFGSNIRNFLRDAVTVQPPAEGSDAEKKGDVLFESKDSSGKKVVHATRFDAQLHVIHSTLDSFLKDPASPEWENWKKEFNVEQKTDAIAKDLEKHEELRSAMEKCVPEKVDYPTFWCRYYFLRHVIESEEQKRREMLKASAAPSNDEEVGWDEESSEEESEDDSDEDDSDDDDSATQTPNQPTNKSATNLSASTKTLKPTDDDKLKPAQPRRSNDEKSVADSDASYDVVSGATSRAPGSPQLEKTAPLEKKPVAEEESEEESDEDSEEEDWE
ncbi:hypothetical protein ACN47E_009921 [Coniothyrium glycines]